MLRPSAQCSCSVLEGQVLEHCSSLLVTNYKKAKAVFWPFTKNVKEVNVNDYKYVRTETPNQNVENHFYFKY